MNTIIFLAGGCGRRFGSETPKQFVEVDGKCIWRYTLENLHAAKELDAIVVVVHPDWRETLREQISRADFPKVRAIVDGGDTRMRSAINGMRAALPFTDGVLGDVDANRPLAKPEEFDRVIRAAEEHGLATSMSRIYNTIARISEPGGPAVANEDRNLLLSASTPECARVQYYTELHRRAEEDGITDNSLTTLALRFGYKVEPVIVPPSNFKITCPEDLLLFKAYLYYEKSLKDNG